MLHKAPFIGGVISTDLMLCYFSWIKAYVDLLGKIFHQIMLSLYQKYVIKTQIKPLGYIATILSN